MNITPITINAASRKEAVYYAPECDIVQSALTYIICGSGAASAPAFNIPDVFPW